MLFHLIIDGEGDSMIHFLLNLITDMGEDIFVAVVTSLICLRSPRSGKRTTHPHQIVVVLLLTRLNCLEK